MLTEMMSRNRLEGVLRLSLCVGPRGVVLCLYAAAIAGGGQLTATAVFEIPIVGDEI
jgi:hypothetical protein